MDQAVLPKASAADHVADAAAAAESGAPQVGWALREAAQQNLHAFLFLAAIGQR